MKKAFLFLFTLVWLSAGAQTDNWKVYHNNRLKIQAGNEDETKNSFSISKKDLSEPGFLWIVYVEKSSNKNWKRTIALFDATDKELAKHSGTICKIGNAYLQTISNKVKQIKFYTWSLPEDPKEAARIRVRRIHLCTIRFTE